MKKYAIEVSSKGVIWLLANYVNGVPGGTRMFNSKEEADAQVKSEKGLHDSYVFRVFELNVKPLE